MASGPPANLQGPPAGPTRATPSFVNLPILTSVNSLGRSKEIWDKLEAMPDSFDDTLMLEGYIKSYNTKYMNDWSFDLLHSVVDEFSQQEKDEFFDEILPGIISLAKKLPTLVTGPLETLKMGENKSVELSKHAIASLLANAFLCTIPYRNDLAANSVFGNFPSINFNTLLTSDTPINKEKLKCLFNYFGRVSSTEPEGNVKFSRVCLTAATQPDWALSEKPVTCFYMQSLDARFEKLDCIQVDFSGPKIGREVLNCGAGQEDIRFITCPELIVARLFTEQLYEGEALVVRGVEQYSDYTGYRDNFKFVKDFQDDPQTAAERVLVAIDALDFSQPLHNFGLLSNSSCSVEKILRENFLTSTQKVLRFYSQFTKKFIDRELNKAFAGFRCAFGAIKRDAPIGTGNWGCGVLNGDSVLKAKIQHLAASQAGRHVLYCPFGDANVLTKVSQQVFRGMHVKDCYKELLEYAQTRVEKELKYSIVAPVTPICLAKPTVAAVPAANPSVVVVAVPAAINASMAAVPASNISASFPAATTPAKKKQKKSHLKSTYALRKKKGP